MRQGHVGTTWFLVADGARASVLAAEDGRGGVAPVFGYLLTSPGRAHSLKALTDRAGRCFDSMGRTRHAMEPRTDWKTMVRRDFAGRLGAVVEKAALEGRFAHLVLVAPPKLLGMLRESLGKAGRRALARCVGKDMTHLAAGELGKKLKELSAA